VQNFRGVFDHNRKQLTEKFDGEGKLVNVMQFQEGNWSFVNFRGVIDETYNFRGEIAYLLFFFYLMLQCSGLGKYDNFASITCKEAEWKWVSILMLVMEGSWKVW